MKKNDIFVHFLKLPLDSHAESDSVSLCHYINNDGPSNRFEACDIVNVFRGPTIC